MKSLDRTKYERYYAVMPVICQDKSLEVSVRGEWRFCVSLLHNIRLYRSKSKG